MTPRPTSDAERAPLRVVIVTLDNHLAAAVERAQASLARDLPGARLTLHAASDFASDPAALERCHADIARGDIILACMLFVEEHIQAVLPALQARREACDAMVGALSAGEIIRLTKLGPFTMDGSAKGPMAWLKRLRGTKKSAASSGAGQMKMLRRLPKILRFIPGAAQDLRAYFLTMQYWLAGSDDNIANLARCLIGRYAAGPRAGLRAAANAAPPVDYPDIGLYHPRLPDRITEQARDLPSADGERGVVGLLIMRAYVLAGDAKHYDGVIAALEARGLTVRPAFASGLDSRPAIEEHFFEDGRPSVDAVVSLTGFSLVGGPAYNDAAAAQDMLARLDVPYLAAHALEFQTLETWGQASDGLSPIEATMMVALPELDGATTPMVFGGRSNGCGEPCQGCERACVHPASDNRRMIACPERAEALAARVAKLVALRRRAAAERKVAIVLFNFPPNSGAVGTAAHLSVFASLHNTLTAMAAQGYRVEVPQSVDALRARLLGPGAGMGEANVHARIPAEDHVRREPHLAEIESQWGPAPGRQQADGASIHVLGAQFGEVFVGIQPAFGYEGDPMRLLFESGFTPTHAFSAFYRYLREDFGADAIVHFGTHGALEFMPGKQTGMSAACWPERLIGDTPNIYLYAANNPSEGAIAKRRSGATLVSYLTPPVAEAGLYRGLVDLKGSLDRWRACPPDHAAERAGLAELIQAQAGELDLAAAEPAWTDGGESEIPALAARVAEYEHALIPDGLHTVGEAPNAEERAEVLAAASEAMAGGPLPRATIDVIVAGAEPDVSSATDEVREAIAALSRMNRALCEDHEIPALLRALEGRYIAPTPGGDLIRSPDILPTGRNIHGFDPWRIPSAYALADGSAQAARLLERHAAEGHGLPETVAMVLWGTDNLKSEGGPIAQALALMGARPRRDSYGRLAGAELIPLEELGRPRIDVVATLSGIFRDLLPLQTKLLADAAYQAATAEEPADRNFVRAHALAYMAEAGCDIDTAALRVFSNADGAYGANVNQLIDAGCWSEEDELADAYQNRKCYAYGRSGKPARQDALLARALQDVDLAYQNLDSVDLGVTTIDHYVDTLGGIGQAVRRAKGVAAPTYIGDQTRSAGKVRTLSEQVALETRTRMLNPRWYEGLLRHGAEGVRNIEAHVTNTMGWSATTGAVEPWVYQRLSETYVLDPEMRERLAALNPQASARMANRLIEAHERAYWRPDADTLEALRRAGDELEDRLEGVAPEPAGAAA